VPRLTLRRAQAKAPPVAAGLRSSRRRQRSAVLVLLLIALLAALAGLLLLLLLATLLSATLLLTALLATLLLLLLRNLILILVHGCLQKWKRPDGRLRGERKAVSLCSAQVCPVELIRGAELDAQKSLGGLKGARWGVIFCCG
jgi:hypothetical protein